MFLLNEMVVILTKYLSKIIYYGRGGIKSRSVEILSYLIVAVKFVRFN